MFKFVFFILNLMHNIVNVKRSCLSSNNVFLYQNINLLFYYMLMNNIGINVKSSNV